MADRVSVIITIGGDLAASDHDSFVATIIDEGLSLEWDGPAFAAADLVQGVPLALCAHEIAWGRLDDLKAYCLVHRLAFVRWSGGCSGAFGPERAIFIGVGDLKRYATDEENRVVIDAATAARLGSHAAILAHFVAADFAVPPLRLTA